MSQDPRAPPESYTYIILVTVRSGRGNFLEAMRAGVDDFISKPVDPEELVARLVAAERILGVRNELFQLEGLLAICSYCRRLRDDGERWVPHRALHRGPSRARC